MAFRHNSTTAQDEPGWGAIDKTKLPRSAFAYQGESGRKSTWGFPHHWVKDGGDEDDDGIYTNGAMYLHRGGLNAAWSAANGGRSGRKASPEVRRHLQAHREALGIDDSAGGSVPTGAMDGDYDEPGLYSNAVDGVLSIYLYDEISPSGVQPMDFATLLGDNKEAREIALHINSPGGSAWDGAAIYNLLRQHPAAVTAFVDGVAASAATLPLMAADRRVAASGSVIMVHNPSGFVFGPAELMRKTAATLDTLKRSYVGLYAAKTEQTPKRIGELMDAETWMDPETALSLGFVTEIGSNQAADGQPAPISRLSFDLSMYPNAPAAHRGKGRRPRFCDALQVSLKMPEAASIEPLLSLGDGPGDQNQNQAEKEKTMTAANQNDAAAAAQAQQAKLQAETEAKLRAAEEAKAKAEVDLRAAQESLAKLKTDAATAATAAAKKAADEMADRNRRIVEMCQMAHHPEKAAELMGKSDEEAREALFRVLCTERKPVGDAGDSQLGSKKLEDVYREEYRSQKPTMESLGVTEEEYIASRTKQDSQKPRF